MTRITARGAQPIDPNSPLGLGIVVLGAFWASVLGHELAHFGMAWTLYAPADLAAGRVPTAAHVATVAAGPVLTLLTAVGSAVAMPFARSWAGRVAVSTVIGTAASRLLLTAPATLLARGANDERTVGRLMGTSPRALWAFEAVLILGGLVAVAKSLPASERRPTAQWVVLGVAVGWVTALTLGRAAGLPI